MLNFKIKNYSITLMNNNNLREIDISFDNKIIYDKDYQIELDAWYSIPYWFIKKIFNIELEPGEVDSPTTDVYLETYVITFNKYFDLKKISQKKNIYKEANNNTAVSDMEKISKVFRKHRKIAINSIHEHKTNYDALDKKELIQKIRGIFEN